MCQEPTDLATVGDESPRPRALTVSTRRQFLTWGAVGVGAVGAAFATASADPVFAGETRSASAAAPSGAMRPADPLGGAGFGAPTVMSVWAHFDDDLIFAGSRLHDALNAGHFVRTVFLTSGDAGRGDAYARGREEGIRRAYNEMRGSTADWSSTQVTLDSGAIVTAWTPNDTDKVVLIFFGLPDGSLMGTGYPSTGNQSLIKLANGAIGSISDLAKTYTLTWSQLVDSLSAIIGRLTPAMILTSVPGTSEKWSAGDHPDHRTTGTATRAAWKQTGYPGDLVAYSVGYQTEHYPANISGDALDQKINAFVSYASGDPVVGKCTNRDTCLKIPRFGQWLQRQYARSEPDLWTSK